MSSRKLEQVIEEKVRPKLDAAMARFLGVTIREINADITDRIRKNPIFEFDVDTSLSFRKAKEEFRKHYLARLLRLHFGNVSEVAKIAGIDRRSMHRLVKKYRLDPQTHRAEMLSSTYIRKEAVRGIIETTLKEYSSVLNPGKLEELYSNMAQISTEIVQDLPDEPLTLDQAQEAFERKFLAKVLEESTSVSAAARKIKIRYETMHRKMKALGIAAK